MKSRERVLKAINFEEPDRVPIDLGGTTGASGIHVSAYHKLKKHLGLSSNPVKCNDIMQQLAEIEEEILELLHVDVVQISPTSLEKNWKAYPLFKAHDTLLPGKLNLKKENGIWTLTDKQQRKFIKPDESLYFDSEDGTGWFSPEFKLSDENLESLRKCASNLYGSTDYAIAAKFGGGFGDINNPEFLMDLITEPEKANDAMDKHCDKLIEKYKLLNEAVGEYAFCVIFTNDLGSQNAPLISPGLFRETIMLHYKKFTDWLHSETNFKLYLHCCGAVEPLIESFIEMGVDILNPIQTSANGMEPEKLKSKYGGRIVFWGGGCDTQHVLGARPTEEAVEHAKERIKILAPGGGFIFNQIHAIQPAVLPEAICAVFDAAYQFGKYPVNQA